jgi:hypothetical protein
MSKYEELVRFIANDYLELSHEKVMSQRNYWRKLCEKLIREEQIRNYWEERMRNYTDADLLRDIQAIHGKEEGLRQYNECKELDRKNREEHMRRCIENKRIGDKPDIYDYEVVYEENANFIKNKDEVIEGLCKIIESYGEHEGYVPREVYDLYEKYYKGYKTRKEHADRDYLKGLG